MATSADVQDAAVHAGARNKSRGGDAPVEREGEPRIRLGGHQCSPADPSAFACHLPLGDEDRIRPLPLMEEPSEDRCGQVKRDVSDHGGVRDAHAEDVADDDPERSVAAFEAPGAAGIDLHRCDVPPQRQQDIGDGTVAGANFEDGALRCGNESADPPQRGAVAEVILAEFVTTGERGWGLHGKLQKREEHPDEG